MDLENIVIPELGEDADVIVKDEEGTFLFSLKNLINILIEFINKIIKFEF